MIGPFHLAPANALVALLVAEFVLAPLSTLVHELGHAGVALRASSNRVLVVVGRHSQSLEVGFERLQVNFSPIPARGVAFRGVCIWDQGAASQLDRLRCFVAGPIATTALIPVYVVAAVLTGGLAAWIPAAFFLGAFGCVISVLFNLDPRPANAAERAAPGSSRRDGPQALAAYRALRTSPPR